MLILKTEIETENEKSMVKNFLQNIDNRISIQLHTVFKQMAFPHKENHLAQEHRVLSNDFTTPCLNYI